MFATSQREALLKMPPSARAKWLVRKAGEGKPLPVNYEERARLLFANYLSAPFGVRHHEMWQWREDIKEGVPVDPFVAIWPRGSAKSTTAEMVAADCVISKDRKYIWYVCSTQDAADIHVGNIADMLESSAVDEYRPNAAQPKRGKFGHSKGWQRAFIRTSNGVTVEGIGLDKQVRGRKIEEARPDLIIFDDIDDHEDTMATVKKKRKAITDKIIPAKANHATILFVQNLIHVNSIASELANTGRDGAQYLVNRYVSGPHKAIEEFAYEFKEVGGRVKCVITGGRATWEGQSLADCQRLIDEIGVTPFERECQHEVDEPSGGLWDHIEYQHIDFDAVPSVERGCVWVDPAVTNTDDSDRHAIQADGLGVDDKIYRFYSWEQRASPEESLRRAILKCIELGFEVVGVETDQGGDTWRSVFERAWQQIVEDRDIPHITRLTRKPKFMQAKAGAGHGSKVHRNSLMLVDYEHGNVVHVRGTHTALEKSLRRFPNKPLDLADAAYWSWRYLKPNHNQKATSRQG